MEMNKAAKILVLGKARIGKSSFINYFLGTNMAETGKGKPVTKGYCIEYEYNNGKFPIKIYDNEGFEAAIADKQKQEIIDFVAEKNNSENVFNWFHTIFYCTSAHYRFEDFEANFIIDLSKKISQNIHIIMTTCDGIAPQALDEKERHIRQKLESLGNKCHIFRVVSISKKKMDGSNVEPYGKEAISASVFKLLWEDISSKVSKEYAAELRYSMINVLNTSKHNIKTLMKNTINPIGLIKGIKDEASFNDEFDDSLDNIFDELNNSIEECNNKYNKILSPICDLYIAYCNTVMSDSFADQIMLDFNSMMPDFDFDEDDIMKYFPHIQYILDHDSDSFDFETFIKILGGVGEMITLLPRINNAIDDMFNNAINNIPSEVEIERETYKKLMTFLDSFCFVENNI